MKSKKALLLALLLASFARLSAHWAQWAYEYYNPFVASVSADAFVDWMGEAQGSGYIQMLYGNWDIFQAETSVLQKGSGAFETIAFIPPTIGYWGWAGYYGITEEGFDGAQCGVYGLDSCVGALSISQWM